MDQAASAHQTVLWHLRERREGADLDRGVGVRARGHRQEAAQAQGLTLHLTTDFFRDPIRENPFNDGVSQHHPPG